MRNSAETLGKGIHFTVLALTAFAITFRVLISEGLPATHDIFFHFVWFEQFQKALAEGYLYPRWVDTLYGYGTPLFIFYSPLPYYAISGINCFVNSSQFSLKIAIYLTFFLSGVSMYLFAARLSGRTAGALTAVIYQVLPYHVLDLFERGVVAELFSFIWFPLILLFMQEIFCERRPFSMANLSLTYAALILTHLVSAFMFTFVMGAYCLYLLITHRGKGILRTVLAGMTGLILSAFFLLPILRESRFVHLEFIGFFDYRDCFLFLRNNLLAKEFYPFLHATFACEAALFITMMMKKKKGTVERHSGFFLVLLGVTLFMTVPLSSLLWDSVPVFRQLQFPWRWITFSGFSVAVILGAKLASARKKEILIFSLFPLILAGISFLTILKSSSFTRAETDYFTRHSSNFSPVEYRPVWVKNYRDPLPARDRVTVSEGTTVCVLSWTSRYRKVSVQAGRPSLVRFSTFYFPGWECRMGGNMCRIVVQKPGGGMAVEVPEGNHTIELFFTDTPVRHLGKMISVAGIILVVLLVLWGRRDPKGPGLCT